LWPFTYTKAWKRQATSLDPLQYVVVKNRLTGEVRVERGPKLNLLRPFDEELSIGGRIVQKALSLKATEFVQLKDNSTGNVRVVKGETVVVPSANEVGVDGRLPSEAIRSAVHLKFFEGCASRTSGLAIRAWSAERNLSSLTRTKSLRANPSAP